MTRLEVLESTPYLSAHLFQTHITVVILVLPCGCRCWLAGLLMLVVAATPPNITHIESGIVITHTEEAYATKAYAEVYVVVEEPDLSIQDSLSQSIAVLNDTIQSFMSRHPTFFEPVPRTVAYHAWLHRLEVLKQWLQPEASVLSSRHRRGLFDFVGRLSSTLFGTATASDVDNLRRAHNGLVTTVQQVVQDQSKLLASVNSLKAKQDQIIHEVNDHALMVNQLSRKVKQEFQKLESYSQIADALSNMEQTLQFYLHQKAEARFKREACASSEVTESLLPPTLLAKVLDHQINEHKIPALLYYQYLQVQKMFVYGDRMVCHLKVPLLFSERYLVYHLQTYAVPREGLPGLTRVYHDTVVAKGTWQGKLFHPAELKGRNPSIAEIGVLYPQDQAPCLNGLLTKNPHQYETCPVQILKTKDQTKTNRILHSNRFILDTPAATAQYLCAGVPASTVEFQAGLYAVEIAESCNLDSPFWTLIPLQDIRYDVKFRPAPIEIVPFKLPTDVVIAINDTFRELPHTHVLHPAKLPEVKIRSYDAQQHLVPDTHPWWFWLSTVIAVTCLILILGWAGKRYIYPKAIAHQRARDRVVTYTPSTDTEEARVHMTDQGTSPQSGLYPDLSSTEGQTGY